VFVPPPPGQNNAAWAPRTTLSRSKNKSSGDALHLLRTPLTATYHCPSSSFLSFTVSATGSPFRPPRAQQSVLPPSLLLFSPTLSYLHPRKADPCGLARLKPIKRESDPRRHGHCLQTPLS